MPFSILLAINVLGPYIIGIAIVESENVWTFRGGIALLGAQVPRCQISR